MRTVILTVTLFSYDILRGIQHNFRKITLLLLYSGPPLERTEGCVGRRVQTYRLDNVSQHILQCALRVAQSIGSSDVIFPRKRLFSVFLV